MIKWQFGERLEYADLCTPPSLRGGTWYIAVNTYINTYTVSKYTHINHKTRWKGWPLVKAADHIFPPIGLSPITTALLKPTFAEVCALPSHFLFKSVSELLSPLFFTLLSCALWLDCLWTIYNHHSVSLSVFKCGFENLKLCMDKNIILVKLPSLDGVIRC